MGMEEIPGFAATCNRLKQADAELDSLQTAVEWRFHSGSLATPHDPDLDTSDWPLFTEVMKTGNQPPGEAWLRGRIDISRRALGLDLMGSSVRIRLCGLMPAAIYADGRLIIEERFWTSTGEALLPLGEIGEQGLSILMAARTEVSGSGQPGCMLHSPHLICQPRIAAVEAVQEELQTAEAELRIAERLADSSKERELVAQAVALIDIESAAIHNWDAVIASIKSAEEVLQPLSARAKAYTVHLIAHSHIDMNFVWDWPETERVVIRDFESVLAIMRDYPELTFTLGQVPTYMIIKDKRPDLFAELKTRIAEGRWEVAASTWVEGDLNMAAGESLSRHLLHSISWCREHLGVTPAVCLQPDTFGHSGNFPQLLRRAGIRLYFHSRCNPWGTGPSQMPLYWWKGVDGSRVLTASSTYAGIIRPSDVARVMLSHDEKLGSRQSFLVHGAGDHGGGPVRADLDRMRRMQARPLLPTLTCSTFTAFADAVRDEGGDPPETAGELNFIFEGCYTSHADIKEQNRRGENGLLTAETLGTLAGTADREAVADAWRVVLFNQFHDIFDGSGIPLTYAQSAKDSAHVSSIVESETGKALNRLAAGLDTTGEGIPIVVFNPLAWDRRDVVRIRMAEEKIENPVLVNQDGKEVPAQWHGDDLVFIAAVPALGQAVYYLRRGTARNTAPPEETEEGYLIETDRFRVLVLKESGILGSLYDKQAGRELVAYGKSKPDTYSPASRPDLALNVFQILDERPHVMSAWLLDGVMREESLLSGARITVGGSGPVLTSLKVERQVRSSTIAQEIIFYKELGRIDFPTVVDWRERGGPQQGVPNLKVSFTATLGQTKSIFEIPYAAAERPADGQERPALRWADICGHDYGLAVLNDCKYGYDALGSRLRLSLLRSSYEPDLLPDCRGHRFCYALVPHVGDWRDACLPRRGAEFNQPLLTTVTERHEGQTFHSGLRLHGDEATVISALKLAENGQGWIVRLYDSCGKGGKAMLALPADIVRVHSVNPVEENLDGGETVDGEYSVSLAPWEVRSLRLVGLR